MIENKKKICRGCGIPLQDNNLLLEGYTTSLENDLCQRCFRIKNYGEYQAVTRSNEEYIEILKSLQTKRSLVLVVVDLWNQEQDIRLIEKYLPKNVLYVLNKRDVIPKSVKDEKILEYFTKDGIDPNRLVIVSTKTNYQMDLLLSKINEYKVGKRVYVTGKTNVGKSSLINQMIRLYSTSTEELTISPLPSTTLDKVEIALNHDLILVDTPGLVDRGSLLNYVKGNELKKIIPKREIKPITFQIKKNQCLIIGDYARIDYIEGEKNSFTCYISNQVKVKKMNALKQTRMTDRSKTTFDTKYREDLVIPGLGWIKMVEKGNIAVYIDKNVQIFTRKSFI